MIEAGGGTGPGQGQGHTNLRPTEGSGQRRGVGPGHAACPTNDPPRRPPKSRPPAQGQGHPNLPQGHAQGQGVPGLRVNRTVCYS